MTTLDPRPTPTDVTQLCERLLADLRTEIARADSKASVLVAALGMTAGVFSALLAGRDWNPAVLSTFGTVVWGAGAAFLVLSLFALLLAVLPRYRSEPWTPGSPSPTSATSNRPYGSASWSLRSPTPSATPRPHSPRRSPRRAASPRASTSGSVPA